MTAVRAVSFALVAALSLASATGPAGSSASSTGGCGPVIEFRDAGLQASFARFERSQSDAASKICAAYRNDMRSAAPR